jgi:hypothetical protein
MGVPRVPAGRHQQGIAGSQTEIAFLAIRLDGRPVLVEPQFHLSSLRPSLAEPD